jgi:hypothetical protein
MVGKRYNMIYSNTNKTLIEKTLPWGVLNCVFMGEEGRGRKFYLLPSEYPLEKGVNMGLSIGLTKSGKPRIVKGESEKTFLLLSSEGGYTRRGNGRVLVLSKNKNSVNKLIECNGADGAAGRTGTWMEYLVEVTDLNEPVYIRVKKGGGCNSTIIKITKNNVEELGEYNSTLAYFDINGYEMPFTILEDGKFNTDEWESI